MDHMKIIISRTFESILLYSGCNFLEHVCARLEGLVVFGNVAEIITINSKIYNYGHSVEVNFRGGVGTAAVSV